MLLRLDSSMAARHLGWQGSLGIEETLDWTVDWFRDFHAGADMRAGSLAQIAAYETVIAETG
jgi:CDP-glucose 4,6-dehydratase